MLALPEERNMNFYQDELTAEYNRQRIVEHFEQIQLEKLASRPRMYRPTLFTRSMYNFANWMISTGKLLRRRYETPAINCTHTPSGSPAR
jgi:hypothetical protein